MRDDFDGFFDREYDPVVRSLTLVFGDRHRAEDAAQTAFERAYRKWRTVSTMARPGTWVYVVALRDARRQIRRESRYDEVAIAPPGFESFEDPAATALAIRSALTGLSLRQRAAVVLRYLGGLSIAEVASVMGCAEGTVKATLHTALLRLRVTLDEEATTNAR